MIDLSLIDDDTIDWPLVNQELSNVVPSFFYEKYPNLIEWLSFYLEDLPSTKTYEMFHNNPYVLKTISKVNSELLKFLEDELALGYTFSSNDANRRFILQRLSQIIQTKGSLFSIQQFFKILYGVEPDVVYTKRNVFIVDDSLIGPLSDRYIINDRLYQTFAILIRVPIPAQLWEETYRTLIHTAGMYLGAEISLVSVATVENTADDLNHETIISQSVSIGAVSEGAATIGDQTNLETTQLLAYPTPDSDVDGFLRIAPTSTFATFSTLQGFDSAGDSDPLLSLANVSAMYSSIERFIDITSPSVDQDSAVGITPSSTIETVDADQYYYWDSDSDRYLNQILTMSNNTNK